MKEISLDRPTARGRTADVYDWDDGHILKLFHPWFRIEDIEYERSMAQAVHASGVKTPAVGELIQIQGRHGLIYERVAGQSMLTVLLHSPWTVLKYSRLLASLHAQMHECVFDADIPAQQERIRNKIKYAEALTASLKTSLLGALDSLPQGDRVCHGDFHPGNVLVSGKEVTIIDWIDASRGNPLADLARTSIILLGIAATRQASNQFLKIFVKLFHSAYLKEYFRLRPGGEAEYQRWLAVVAGARLSENIPELEAWLIRRASS